MSKSDVTAGSLDLGAAPAVTVRDLITKGTLSLCLFNTDTSVVAASPAWLDIIPDTSANAAALDRARSDYAEQVRRCVAGESVAIPAFQVWSASGEERWAQVQISPWRDSRGVVVYIIAHARDVTGEEAARRLLERSEQRLSAALAIDGALVKEFDFTTGEVFISGGSEQLAAIARDGWFSLLDVYADDQPAVQKALESARLSSGAGMIRTEFRLAAAPETWVSATCQFFRDANGKAGQALLVAQDISERIRHRQQIEALAFTDGLTRLPNRAKFQLEFSAAVTEAEAEGRPLGLILVDVDHFKDINDTLGHDAGDALLKVLADEMGRAFRQNDLVARIGGDEFAILLRDVATEADLERPLAALRKALSEPMQHYGQGFRIATSIGAALHNDPDADPEHLLKNADIALYKAKEMGRDQVVMFEPQMRSAVEKRLELLRDVRAAIHRGEFTLFYQPVVSVGEGSVIGFEALMRWDHPDHGVLAPAHFLAAFEDQDLSLQLGEVAIDTALKQMRAWLDQGLPFGRVSINLSAAQFHTGRLARDLMARLRHWGVPPDRLTVEVTENVYLGWGAEVVGETVRALHAEGVTIALDDFGTGYASLANLRQFPIDRLKIDKSFIQNVDDDAIVRAVINLGASMGMEVVAEGVEKAEQLSTLTRYGCNHVQGYHFARPMPAIEVPRYLRDFNVGVVQEVA